MHIDYKILSIPPYISTSWDYIASLSIDPVQASTLIVTLMDGTHIHVPKLDAMTLEGIFATHAKVIQLKNKQLPSQPAGFRGQQFSFELPVKDGLIDMQNLNTFIQHNPDQAESPDLPGEIIAKIQEITKTMGLTDEQLIPKPEPHCNCIHCQIARAMRTGLEEGSGALLELEEIVTDDELQFRSWDVAQTSDKLYIVSNPLDSDEHYNVFLGESIGCTCGHPHCEHVKAVLNS